MDRLPDKQAISLAEIDTSSDNLFSTGLIQSALDLARKNPRQRGIIRIHEKLSDEQHLMVNAILGESYIRPHLHAEMEKTETFRIVNGRAFVVFFDDNGNIKKKIEINDNLGGRKVVAVRAGQWHTFVPMSEETVVLEAKRQSKGGYNPATDKTMAAWAPDEGDIAGGQEYLKNLVATLDKP